MVSTRKSGWIKWNKESKKKKLTPTLELTYKLFIKGNSVAKIADLREQKLESIQFHIFKLITMGLISVDDVIGQEKREKIESVINNDNIKSQKLIKELLPDNYTYFEIKCTLAYLSLEPDRVKK